MESKKEQKQVYLSVYSYNHRLMNAWRMSQAEAEEFDRTFRNRLELKETAAIVFYYGKDKRCTFTINPQHISVVEIEHIPDID